MNNAHIPLTRDLVLVGGGHTHALVLRSWAMNPLAGVRVTLINPGPTAAYSGMLPGFVAGHYTRDELDIDLVRLAQIAGARFINGAVSGIDVGARTIEVPDHGPIVYDVCALDIGITSDMPRLEGFADHGVPAKPLGPFAAKWDAFRDSAQSPRVAIIGGGVAGAELAMAMAHALRDRDPQVTLLDRSRVLTDLNRRARQIMQQQLRRNGVTVIEDAAVVRLSAGAVHLADGQTVTADFITGAAGARPHPWQDGIEVDRQDGFICVNRYLQSSDPALFAVGDCAHMRQHPRPKAGVYAVRQAPVLFNNLRAALSGNDLYPYTPQRDYLKLVSLGRKAALAEKFGTALAGGLLWRWKDHIDRSFMTQFDELKLMGAPDLPRTRALDVDTVQGGKPMCGGCGAKVGRGALNRVLQTPTVSRDDVRTIPHDDAAMLVMGDTRQVISTDHLRAIVADPVRMARIAAQHALGDIWAMGAAPQAATATLILPRMSATLQERTLTEIMDAAGAVMSDAGAQIVGGHTSLGAEMTVGFTVTGLCARAPITLGGGQAGDALILTKPIGTGVVMASAMQGVAKGSDVIRALDAMEQGQGPASAILHDAHAMTDVTGFGLAGHLANICAASGVGAVVQAGAVPVLPGALELAETGQRSSLYDDNRSGAGNVTGDLTGPRGELLFDPQTAGGLLAAVSAERAEGYLAALKDAGYSKAAIIGHLRDGSDIHVEA